MTSSAGSRHIWQWLTKRPDRAALFSQWLARQKISWPRNLWIGTSVTTNSVAKRVRQLRDVGGDDTIRFVSAEPLWEHVDLDAHFASGEIHWLITGGTSRQPGELARPVDFAWLRSLRASCERHGVAFFVKQLGGHPVADGRRWVLTLDRGHGGAWQEWPVDLQMRQLPALAAIRPV